MNNTRLSITGMLFFILFSSNFIVAEMPNSIVEGDIVYTVATPDHVEALSTFYNDLTEEDAAKIVIYPEEVRKEMLLNAIIPPDRKSRYFIAIDRTNGLIVSVAMVFLVTDSKELEHILIHEIRSRHPESVLVKRVRYKIPYEKALDFGEPLNRFKYSSITRVHSSLGSFASLSPSPGSPMFKADPRSSPISPRCASFDNTFFQHSSYIYMGGFCTKPGTEYRGRGINTRLQQFALTHLLPHVIEFINFNYSTSICCVYGQVEANKRSRGTVRVVAKYLNKEVRPLIYASLSSTSVITLTLSKFLAFKPTLYLTDDNELAVYPDDHHLTQAGRGVGNVLSYEIFAQQKSIEWKSIGIKGRLLLQRALLT